VRLDEHRVRLDPWRRDGAKDLEQGQRPILGEECRHWIYLTQAWAGLDGQQGWIDPLHRADEVEPSAADLHGLQGLPCF